MNEEQFQLLIEHLQGIQEQLGRIHLELVRLRTEAPPAPQMDAHGRLIVVSPTPQKKESA